MATGTKRVLHRREFLHLSIVVGAGSVLAACGATPTATPVPPTPVPPTATKAPAPTTAPGAAPTAAVAAPTATKPPAAPTTAPVTAPTAAPAAAGKYKEAPMLADLVKAGKLPTIDKRLPAEPVVVKPVRKVGKYGGTAYAEGISVATSSDAQMLGEVALFRFANDLSSHTPYVATSYQFNADYTQCTINLRKGVKWSDGTPFTSDDMIFYFTDSEFNTDYAPVTNAYWQPGGKRMEVVKVDDYSVRFEFAAPYPCFPLLMKTSGPIRAWLPKAWCQKYLPKYNPNADTEAKAAGFTNWQAQWKKIVQYYGELLVGEPVLNPWIPTKNSPTQELWERNPYYFEVDTEGNQLPYIDRWNVEVAANLEIFNLKAVSGQLTICGNNLATVNYPLLKQNETTGNYRVVNTFLEHGTDVGQAFNQEHPDPVLKKIFRDVRFRRAMSLAINREEINKLVYLGMGKPSQATINSSASFFKKEWAENYAQFDVKKAEQLMIEVGLKRGADGIWQRPDGKPLAFMLEYPAEEGPKKEVNELVGKYWKAFGVQVDVQLREKTYLITRVQSGQQDCSSWHANRELERSAWVEGWSGSKLGVGGSDCLTYAQAWKNWISSGGKSGVEPPKEALDMVDAYRKWQSYGFGTPEYTAAAIKVHDMMAETLYVIGTVGEGPFPVVVSNNLENAFTDDELSGKKKYWWGAASWLLWCVNGPQLFLKNV